MIGASPRLISSIISMRGWARSAPYDTLDLLPLSDGGPGFLDVVGGVLGYFILGYVHAFIPYALAIAAASFIYIAVADLVPGLHRHIDSKSSFSQLGLMLLGVFTVVLQHQFIHF